MKFNKVDLQVNELFAAAGRQLTSGARYLAASPPCVTSLAH